MRNSVHVSVILCVDDQESDAQLDLFKKVLETVGYRVLTARNAFRALEIFRASHIDLVLTEHILSAIGGRTLVATMKNLKPHVPVAIYSASLAEPAEGCEHADMFITKLVSIDELLEAIGRLLATDATEAAGIT